MNDVESWIYFDGPEPALLRPLLDALRDLPPATPEDRERAVRRFLERLDAMSFSVSPGQAPAGGEEGEEEGSGPAGAPHAPHAPPESIEPVAPKASIAAPNAERRGNKDDVTARSLTFEDRSDVLLPVEPRVPKARGERVTEGAGTAPVPDLPAEVWQMLGRMPFRPAPPGQAPATTAQVPVVARGQGETAPIGEDALAKAAPALPFAGNTAGKAIVPFPQLKLQEYTSLRAELAVWPARTGEILLRYHVPSEAARKALEEYWAARLAGNRRERAVFEWAEGEYSAWLQGRRG